MSDDGASKVEATKAELRLAFYRHWRVYQQYVQSTSPEVKIEAPSFWLLLFYAVECGLKVAIMKKNPRCKHTGDLDEALRSHNIELLLNNIGYGGSGVRPMTHGADSRKRAKAAKIHLIWRYGITYHANSAKEVVERLTQVAKWLESEAV